MAWTGQVKTLLDAREFAKLLLDESGDLFWTQTEQTALACEANRAVFRELVATNPEYFIADEDGPFTWAKDTEYVSLNTASFLGANILPYKIIGVEDTEKASAVARDNRPRKWKPMRFQDRNMISNTAESLYGDLGRYYVVVRNRMYVSPIPEKALNVHIYWIPHIADISNDDHVLLSVTGDPPIAGNAPTNGAAEEFGDLVGVYLAKLMNSKQQGQNQTIEQLWTEGVARMNNNAQLRNVDEPMSVRVTRGPWE